MGISFSYILFNNGWDYFYVVVCNEGGCMLVLSSFIVSVLVYIVLGKVNVLMVLSSINVNLLMVFNWYVVGGSVVGVYYEVWYIVFN